MINGLRCSSHNLGEVGDLLVGEGVAVDGDDGHEELVPGDGGGGEGGDVRRLDRDLHRVGRARRQVRDGGLHLVLLRRRRFDLGRKEQDDYIQACGASYVKLCRQHEMRAHLKTNSLKKATWNA